MNDKPHILFIADGRSPTTKSWVKNVLSLDFKVSLLSSYPCDELQGLKHFYVVPLAFSNFGRKKLQKEKITPVRNTQKSFIPYLLHNYSNFFQGLRYFLGPLSIKLFQKKYKNFLDHINPDIVHALRIPYEGIMGRFTPPGLPLVVSSWGNDFTLHAKKSNTISLETKLCLQRANSFVADSKSDLLFACEHGLADGVSTYFIPGSGGINLEEIKKISKKTFNGAIYGLPKNSTWVVNARGFRPGYIHNDSFFQAIRLILKENDSVVFICPGLAEFTSLLSHLDPEQQSHVFMLPKLPQEQLWSLFMQCKIFVSPSSHDGTPNSLVEAMACGSFPIAGDIPSIRDWIQHGINGLLMDPKKPEAIANEILSALSSPHLITNASKINYELVQNQASLEVNLPKIKKLYFELLNKRG